MTGRTPTSTTTRRQATPRVASLRVDADRARRMWALAPAERVQAAEQGQLSLGEMLQWAAAPRTRCRSSTASSSSSPGWPSREEDPVPCPTLSVSAATTPSTTPSDQRRALGELMSPAARGGGDVRAASFPAPAAYATRGQATPAQRRSAAPPGREPGAER